MSGEIGGDPKGEAAEDENLREAKGVEVALVDKSY